MRNTLKATTLERKFPLLAVENGCIISKDADITVAFRVELPELFTVTSAEYEAIHSAWYKAIKVLPDYWGWDGTFNGYFDIDILQPEGEGTGHDADGYVYRAAMVTGIRPMAEGDPATLDEGMVLEDFTASIRNGGFFLALRGIINTTDQNAARKIPPSCCIMQTVPSFAGRNVRSANLPVA